MNRYFYSLWLPLQIVTATCLFAVFSNIIDLNWLYVFAAWFLIGPIGSGVGFHKLFSHRQFETWKPLEYFIAIMGTLACYAPLLLWVSQHKHHHKITDTENDISSPTQHGFFESFMWWRLRQRVFDNMNFMNFCSRAIIKDKFLMFVSNNFATINITVAIALFLWDPFWLVNLYIIPVLIEHTRLNLVSSLCHMKLPGSYKLFPTDDCAYNHVLLGYLTLGFGWHNAHHNDAGELVNSHRWWEFDIEGQIAKVISR